MADQALVFLVRDIPDGSSRSEIALRAGQLDLADASLESGNIAIDWARNEFYIEARCSVSARLSLVCQRSLDPFTVDVASSYQIVFKPDAEDDADDAAATRPFSRDGMHVDLTQDVRDTLMLQIPIQPIHPRYFSEDGQLTDFETVQFGGADEPGNGSLPDPRWDKLRTLQNAHGV